MSEIDYFDWFHKSVPYGSANASQSLTFDASQRTQSKLTAKFRPIRCRVLMFMFVRVAFWVCKGFAKFDIQSAPADPALYCAFDAVLGEVR